MEDISPSPPGSANEGLNFIRQIGFERSIPIVFIQFRLCYLETEKQKDMRNQTFKNVPEHSNHARIHYIPGVSTETTSY